MFHRNTILLAGFLFVVITSVLAGDVNGKWTTTISTQIGDMPYAYTFKADGEKLTGTAKSKSLVAKSKAMTFRSSKTSSIRICRFALNTKAGFLATKSNSHGRLANSARKNLLPNVRNNNAQTQLPLQG